MVSGLSSSIAPSNYCSTHAHSSFLADLSATLLKSVISGKAVAPVRERGKSGRPCKRLGWSNLIYHSGVAHRAEPSHFLKWRTFLVRLSRK